jgi:predicted amino acid dehydrogenase
MVTMERPIPSVDGTPPPTMAQAGVESSNAEIAIIGAMIFIGAAIARNLSTAKGRFRLVLARTPC